MKVTRSVLAATVCGLGFIARTGLGQVIYVDAAAAPGGTGLSWGSAYNDLQAGLAAARSSLAVTEVRVAGGVYRPGPAGDRGVSFQLVERVALRGGYAGGASATPDARDLRGTPTVLSGDLAGDDIGGDGRGVRTDNAYHVVTAVGLAYPAVIDGFHITGGRADGAGEGETQGGGLYVDQCGSNLVVSRCVIRDNDATVGAGAVVLDTQAVLTQCVIVGNRAFGWPGVLVYGFRLPLVPTIDHCTIAFNTGSSGSSAGIRAVASMPDPDPEAAPGSIVMLKTPVRSSIIVFNDRGVETYMPLQVSGFTDAVSCASMNTEGWDDELNVFGEPVFADPRGPDGVVGTLDDDLRLRPLSVGIDGGGSAGSDAGDVDGDGDTGEAAPLDVDGSVRVYGATSDIGASEGPVLTVVTSPEPVSVSEGGSVSFAVRFTRDPGRSIRVSTAAAVVGGAAPVATPAFVDIDSTNWETGVAVSVGWQTDAGLTDDTTPMVFTGAGIATAEQAFTQVDGTTPPGVLYVNPGGTLPPDGASWASGYRTIEAALSVAASFPAIQAVWVKSGTYLPPLPAGVTDGSQRVYVVRPGLKVIGGFSGTETSPSQRTVPLNHSVINGDLMGNDGPQFSFYGDNITTVFRINNATDGTELDGFHLTHAKGPAVSAVGGVAGDRLNVRNCRFTYNQGTSLGKTSSGGNRSGVYDCVFEDTGSPFSSSTTLSLSANSEGNPDGVVEVQGCVFRRVGGSGSACTLSFGGPRLEMSGCTFTNCTSPSGTAFVQMFGAPGSNVFTTVSGCVFNDNGSGLVIRAQSAWMATVLTSRVTNCTFRNTGLGLDPTPVGEVIGCLFENNLGGGGRGKGYKNCVFRGNRAMYAGAGPQEAEGCLFENNTATHGGGAVESSNGTFLRCTFRNNSAPRGGAVLQARRLESCVFEGNIATSGTGGAVESAYFADSCTFSGNTAAGDGGAGSISFVSGCKFYGNTSGGRGGALYTPTQIVNSVFTGNTAGGSGGAVYRVYRMLGCTVYGNHASEAGGVDAPQSGFELSTIANSILWGNTATSGTLEEKQVRTPVHANNPELEILSGSSASAGQVWGTGTLVLGPSSGGFSPAAIAAAKAVPFGPPYINTYACATPAGGLTEMTPARSQPEKWISVLNPSNPSMPSALMRLGTPATPRIFSRVEWRFSFASDGTVGDAESPGLYLGAVAIPGTTGGSIDQQTDWVLDVSDAVEPMENKPQGVYIRNDDGFAGLRFRSNMIYYLPALSHCIVQGLSVHAGEGNSSADPQLAAIAGPDEIVGTIDDDATPLLTSPIVDSGNSRMIGTDEGDVDLDLNTVEPVLTDLVGNPRIADCPVNNTSVGARGPVDRGAIEIPPFQALLAPPCAADIGSAGGVYGRDGVLDNNDFIAFIDAFFLFSPVADVGTAGGVAGSDGLLDNNDFIVFIDQFFAGC